MCGIAGILKHDGSSVFTDNVKRMSQALAHRGPDGDGIYVDGQIGLGHKRLAILDTSADGNQPMTSKDQRWTVVFNGCIYNFLELRQKLRAKGHSFTTATDTEVITEGLAAFGTSFIEELNGMFAIAAWDSVNKELYLSRDRFGIKPLYYYEGNGILLFASEIKAIIAHPGYKATLNYSALNEYFTFQNLFSFQTLFEGVHMIPPANTIKIGREQKRVKHNSWWDYDFSKTEESMSFEYAKEETERLFHQAVTRQMISDVPVGSYLSGGMDSGSITSVASQHVARLATFTCGFDMSEVTGVEANFDERRDAELMANHFKTEHFEQVMNAGDIRWSLPKLVYHLEDLRVGMSYPNYYIARLASKFVKVCLQGTGGDELFGGYPWRYYRVFGALNQQEFFDQYYGFWQRLVPDHQKEQIFTAEVRQNIDLQEPREVFERVFKFNTDLGYETPEQHINNSLYFEAKTFLPGLFLVGDKLAMAHGLEERFPFMDNDLVDFAMKIPVKHKLGNLTKEIAELDENREKKKSIAYREFDDGKNVLRQAMKDFIPEKIINRKKQGFSAPDESWYRGENAAYIKDLLLNQNTVSSMYINPDYVKRIVREHTEDHVNHRLLIWSLMNFEWWCRIFLDNYKIS
ncbi:asparagine synthase (glutamine-hydrolyzing) [Roseivirga sp. 4D4]|uniref:asparagine synthase (glutamine-hydrolyzing) n=1 Tax=Roseivirga sp. 4D4 TaxID=1889784 RepID=UPI0008534403|nr:asparagine synthase (glutamine-hydrolyzing) [Roseivirga sp. 4D4]OEK02502.1 asparagine synthase (glutamine-hydrolyzing) [Roseivirga sp. 4D4]